MALSVKRTSDGRDYKVKGMSLAESGFDELRRLTYELPFSYPSDLHLCDLKGAKITYFGPVNAASAYFIKYLTVRGAKVRHCCASITESENTQDHMAAATVRYCGASVFAWKDATPEEFLWCIDRALGWKDDGGPDLIVGDCPDSTLLINMGVKAEEEYENTGELPDPSSAENEKSQMFLTFIRDALRTDSYRYRKIKKSRGRMSKFAIRAVKSLCQWIKSDAEWITNAASVTRTSSESKEDHSHHHHCTVEQSVNNTNAAVCGYNEDAKSCVTALTQAGYSVVVTKIDSNCAYRADKSIVPVMDFDNVVAETDIFLTITGNKVITLSDMIEMKSSTFLGNVGSYDDAIDMDKLRDYPGVKCFAIAPLIDKWIFSDTGSSLIVLNKGRSMNLDDAMKLISSMKPCASVDSVVEPTKDMVIHLAEPRDKNGTGTGTPGKMLRAQSKRFDQDVAASSSCVNFGVDLTEDMTIPLVEPGDKNRTGVSGKKLRVRSKRSDQDLAASSSVYRGAESTEEQPEFINVSIGFSINLLPGTEGIKWDITGKLPRNWCTYLMILLFLIASYVAASKVAVQFTL